MDKPTNLVTAKTKGLKRKLIWNCCRTVVYKDKPCICRYMKPIHRFIKNCRDIYKNLPTIQYERTSISYSDIGSFMLSRKGNNDTNNKMRENIIGAIINKNIPETFYKYSPRWKMMKSNVDDYLTELIKQKAEDGSIPSIETAKCIHRGGRSFHYDFTIVINTSFEFNVELKFNAANIKDTPQYVSPMKPSQYLSLSFEDDFYDNFLQKIANASINPLALPDREEYMKTVHGPSPACVEEFQSKYYRGCKKSSQYSGNEDDIKFYTNALKVSKESISQFIEKTDLDIEKLSDYLFETQKDKVYMLYKDNKFHIERVNLADYKISEYKKLPSKAMYLATTETGNKMKILLRWKNGNGIAYPAFQIS